MQQSPPYMRAPRKITTDEVQWYLDENKKLILAIMENTKLGKLDKCAEYQEKLQQNIMYLATIADWQHSQTLIMPTQMIPPPFRMQPEYYMQHPQGVAMVQQQGISPPNMPLQFGNPQQQLHQHAIQGPITMIGNGTYPIHSETVLEGGHNGGSTSTASPNDACGGSMRGASEDGDG